MSECAGDKVDEVFIGSCMTNTSATLSAGIGNYRAAAKILDGAGTVKGGVYGFVLPPVWMNNNYAREGVYGIFAAAGARTEMPGCSLCTCSERSRTMGNQARVEDNATVFSTSTRNFNHPMGKGAQVYLDSAELAAVCALLGKIPTVEEYMTIVAVSC